MINYIFIFLVITSVTHAQVCDENTGTLSSLLPPVCLKGDFKKTDLELKLKTSIKIQKFCESCFHPLVDKYVKTEEEKLKERVEENKTMGRIIFEEVQKELTPLALDLEKMNSSDALSFDPSQAAQNCNFTNNLKIPSCLLNSMSNEFKEYAAGFSSLRRSVENSFATEIASNRYNNRIKAEGLFTRGELNKSCDISDGDAINVYTKYSESLLTPDLIKALIATKVPEGKTLSLILKDDEQAITNKDLFYLQQHPLFKTLLKDDTHLKQFLLDAENLKPNEIVKLLYSNNNAKLFAEDIALRCKNTFEKASTYLENVYCKKTPSYFYDDLPSMEAKSKKLFANMDDKEDKPDELIREHCSVYNSHTKESIGFSTIRNDINVSNKFNLAKLPLNDFKSDAYSRIINAPIENMCKAKHDKVCKTKIDDPDCKMVTIYNEIIKERTENKSLPTPNANVKVILGSLFSSGSPQKADGTVDTISLDKLKKEGFYDGLKARSTNIPNTKTLTPESSTSSSKSDSTKTSSDTKKTFAQTKQTEPEASKDITKITNAPDFKDSPYQPSTASNQSTRLRETAVERIEKINADSGMSDLDKEKILRKLQNQGKSGSNTDLEPNIAATRENKTSPTGSFENEGTQLPIIPSAVYTAPTNKERPNFVQGVSTAEKVTLDKAGPKQSSYDKAILDANMRQQELPLMDNGLAPANSTSHTSTTSPGLNTTTKDNLKPETAAREVKNNLVALLQAESKELLISNQDLTVTKTDEAFIVKVKNYDEIRFVLNEAKTEFVVETKKNKTSPLPDKYLKTIAGYLNKTLGESIKERKSTRDQLKDTLSYK